MTTALRLTGMTIDQKVRSGPAPSVFAACISSSGMPDMNAANTRTPNGTAMVESATIRPGALLRMPSLR